ncbi:hypothetical protein VTK26DRAFT_7960 [Humicola hyalothermophila]
MESCGGRDGLEETCTAEDVADVDPGDELLGVSVRDGGLVCRDPPVGVNLNGIQQLKAVDKECNLREGLDIDRSRHTGTPAVDGIHDDGNRGRVESLSQLQVHTAIRLFCEPRSAGLEYIPEHARCERKVFRRHLDAEAWSESWSCRLNPRLVFCAVDSIGIFLGQRRSLVFIRGDNE